MHPDVTKTILRVQNLELFQFVTPYGYVNYIAFNTIIFIFGNLISKAGKYLLQ